MVLLFVCDPTASVDTAFLLLRSPWQDGGRCQPRFDVAHRVGPLCDTHVTLGFSTVFFFFGCSLSDTGSEKIDRTVTKSLLSVQRNVLIVD